MSAKAVAWAWEQDLPAAEKFLLVALCEGASPDGMVVGGQAAQTELAAMIGAGERTVRTNLAKLEAREGLIARWPMFEGGVRVPDLIRVGCDGSVDLPADFAVGQISRALQSSSSPPKGEEKVVGKGSGEGVEAVAGFAELSPESAADVREMLRRKVKVDRLQVTPEEIVKAALALAAFNAAQGADHGLGANLPKLVGRIRERPSWDAAKLVRLVESAWRLKWWENSGSGRRPTPAVVFGNANVFEQVAMDAKQEAEGVAIADTPERRGRFTRSVEPE